MVHGTVGGMDAPLLPATLLLYAVAIALPLFVALLVLSARRNAAPPPDVEPDDRDGS